MLIGQEDYNMVESAIKVFLMTRNGAARTVMHWTIRTMLERIGLERIDFDFFSIQKEDNRIWFIPQDYITERSSSCSQAN